MSWFRQVCLTWRGRSGAGPGSEGWRGSLDFLHHHGDAALGGDGRGGRGVMQVRPITH